MSAVAVQDLYRRLDPSTVLTDGGFPDPDPWQVRACRSTARRSAWLIGRQCGKSLTAAAVALATALHQDGALVLLLAPSARQSIEQFKSKVCVLWQNLGRPLFLTEPTMTSLFLANGARLIALPGSSDDTVRGFSSVSLLVCDEAARISDELYYALRPTLAVSNGRLLALSTPAGRRGWFHSEWTGTGSWERIIITADQCKRIAPDFLAAERASLGDRVYMQEYECVFGEASGAVFSEQEIQACLDATLKPLDLGG
jgi:hypothetical protein